MSPWYSNLSKYTWIKLILAVLFVLVNVALYTQSKHIILETIFPQSGTKNSVIIIPGTVNNSNSNSSFTFLPQYNMLNDSTATVSVMDSTATVSVMDSTTPDHTSGTTVRLEKPFFHEKIVNPHDFGYIITPNVTCSNRDIELVICVPVGHDNYEGRTVIRSTWGSYAYNISNKALLVFFVGSNSLVSNISHNISQESLTYGDILKEDFIDSYNNLSLKTVSILKWVSLFCASAQFVLKADDDMYVNIPFLVKILREYAADKSTPDAFIIGSVQENAHPIRNPSSKWYTPVSVYPDNTYPKYVSGTAYAITRKAAFLLYEASLRVPIFWLEDIYTTGLCARKASIEIYNSGYFTYGKPTTSGCSFKTHISGHRYTHQEILHIHKELYDPNLRC